MGALAMRKDIANAIGAALSIIAFVFSFVCLEFGEYGCDIETIPALMPGWSGSGLEDIVSFLAGLVLLVGMIAFKGKARCLCVSASLAIYVLSFGLYVMQYSDNVLALLLALLDPHFILVIAPFALSLAGALYMLAGGDDGSAVLLASALGLIAFALLLMFLGKMPFGEDFEGTRYLSTFLRYSATWLCVPFACADMKPCVNDDKGQIALVDPGRASNSGLYEAKLKAGAEMVKALKELLDMDAITLEEYEAKKRELLGL